MMKKNEQIVKRIEELRQLMSERGIDMYLIPTADFHESEYAGDYFKCRSFITGFTGSAGTAVITRKEAGLWTDGRYFLQAEEQLEGTGITLYKMGQEGVPAVEEYIIGKAKAGNRLAFDGRVVNARMGSGLERALKEKGVSVIYGEDLIDRIWTDRPAISAKPAFFIEESRTGSSRTDKIQRVRESMKREGAGIHILTTLDDIAWILNMRGNDVTCNPVVLSYAVISNEDFWLFVQENVLSSEMETKLKEDGVTVLSYHDFYDFAREIEPDKTVLLDQSKINFTLLKCLNPKIQIKDKPNPSVLMKAVKTKEEIECERCAHIKDGVAVTRFMHWIKNHAGIERITELSASAYLEHFREEQEGYLEPSFETIAAYGANGAIVHYEPTEESDTEIRPAELFLVDSGGQYKDGTTDVTRTFVLGEITQEQKRHFTAVMKGMLNLAAAKFLYGCRGINLDYLARSPLWEMGMDYNHGTGHGVGFLLNVHEAPNGIRWRVVPERVDSCILEEGMITSDEPGVYIAGSHGIRLENLILCKKAEKTEYGQFMEFEHLTAVPIDLDGVALEELGEEDRRKLNEYHEFVYQTLKPHMREDELEWLREYTRPV